ncbi:hypothetical protein SAMN04487895_109275 [Paenibacillus sophorae]|uniref:ABC-2 type transport system permease protein n=2 Tax=Paenibacillus sophorae TaxID=1333845 RepID=A0A1H8RFC9_9BACL|nr:hypothetical protein [Paenibacillus sophorae]SEO64844.1 hypothetical protein SAMN04487895_109275 [Paenibacillus sophorae]
MKEFLTLRMLDKVKPLFLKAGIDYDILRRILQVKLTMDQRRTSTVFANSSSGSKPEYTRKGNVLKQTNSGASPLSSIKSLWAYGLIGAIGITPVLLLGDNYMLQAGIVFSFILFFLTTTMVSDFSSVLLDLKDRHILHTKPVDARTLAAAKTVHILSYLVSLSASLTIIPLLVSLFRHGLPFFLLFLFEIFSADIFVVVATSLMYLLVLKFFDGEKLKDIINYVQIGLSVTLTIGYQIMFRVLDIINFSASFTVNWWHFLLPPFWFAAPFEWLLQGNSRLSVLILSALSVVVPLLCVFVYIRFGSSFERYLQKMADSGKYEKRKTKGLHLSLARVLCRSRDEAIFYSFAARMMSREREFKLKVYPMLGFAVIFPYIFILNNLSDSSWAAISRSSLYLFIYFTALFLPSVVALLRYSGNYKGSYIYRTLPLEDINAIHKGAIKAAITRLFLPLYLLDSIVFLLIFGLRIFPDLITVLLAVILYTAISYRMEGRGLPFSESFKNLQQLGMSKTLPAIFLLAVFAGMHYAASIFPYGIYVYAAVLVILNVLFWHNGFNRMETIFEK